MMVFVRKVTRTRFVRTDSQSDAKLSTSSLEKAKRYKINDVFDADVLTSPKDKLLVRSGTPMRRSRRLMPRN